MLLAIDTSNEWTGIAFWDASGLRAESIWTSGRKHTEQVPAQIDVLTRHLGIVQADIQAVAVATGPGSWSGLRAGMSLAKAIAVALSIPIIGVSTLDALAQSQRGRQEPVLALIRLGRDRYAAARYHDTPDGQQRDGEIGTYMLDEVRELARGALVTGDVPPTLEGIAAAHVADRQRRAPYLAEHAWARHQAQDYDDIVALEPLYLGNPVR